MYSMQCGQIEQIPAQLSGFGSNFACLLVGGHNLGEFGVYSAILVQIGFKQGHAVR